MSITTTTKRKRGRPALGPLSNVEKNRRAQARKLANKESASRARSRQREYVESLESNVEQLQSEKEALLKRIADLERANSAISTPFQTYSSTMVLPADKSAVLATSPQLERAAPMYLLYLLWTLSTTRSDIRSQTDRKKPRRILPSSSGIPPSSKTTEISNSLRLRFTELRDHMDAG